MRTWLWIWAVLAVLLASPVRAQTVRGILLEQESARPVAGTLVVLLDQNGEQRGSVLTDAAGRFILQAPSPGRYRLRAERIGYPSTTSPVLELSAGQDLDYRLTTASQTIELEGLVVKGSKRRCAIRAEAGVETATLWEEARKALSAAVHTQRRGRFRFTAERYSRELDLRTGRVRRESTQSRSGVGTDPFVSLPVEELRRSGYVHAGPAGLEEAVFYAPDAEVLLSDEFLDDHCFRVQVGKSEQAGLIGLAFHPVGGRKLPDVKGVLWLDRKTAELRHLEYGYTGIELDGPTEKLGGRVEFERLPNGAWIVRRWKIRTPVVEKRLVQWRNASRQERTVIMALREEGGEVTEIRTPAGMRLGGSIRSALAGEVFDSVHAEPMVGANVFLSGTAYSTRTDAKGRFRMQDLPEGVYSVGFSHPRLDSLGISFPPRDVTLRQGETSETALSVSVHDLISALCPNGLQKGMGIVVGLVRDTSTGAPLPGAQVSLVWKRFSVEGEVSQSLVENRNGFRVTSNDRGAYRVCDVPMNVRVAAEADLEEQRSARATFTLSERPILQQDLYLSTRTETAAAGRQPARPVAIDPIVVKVLSEQARETRARGTRRDLLVRSDIEGMGGVRHIGEIIRKKFPNLRVLETAGGRGSIAQELCVQSNRRTVTLREGSATQCYPTEVYVDGARIPEPGEYLLTLSPSSVESIEFLSPVVAGARYGTGSGRGVLEIYTRGNGPHARSSSR
jgi:hypothetical protein